MFSEFSKDERWHVHLMRFFCGLSVKLCVNTCRDIYVKIILTLPSRVHVSKELCRWSKFPAFPPRLWHPRVQAWWIPTYRAPIGSILNPLVGKFSEDTRKKGKGENMDISRLAGLFCHDMIGWRVADDQGSLASEWNRLFILRLCGAIYSLFIRLHLRVW